MGLVVRVDRPIDLGHPRRHAVAGEQRKRVAELVAIERPLRLTDHDRLDPAAGVGERGKESAGAGGHLACLGGALHRGEYHRNLRQDPGLPFRIGDPPGCLGLAGQRLRVLSLRINLRRCGLAWFLLAHPSRARSARTAACGKVWVNLAVEAGRPHAGKASWTGRCHGKWRDPAGARFTPQGGAGGTGAVLRRGCQYGPVGRCGVPKPRTPAAGAASYASRHTPASETGRCPLAGSEPGYIGLPTRL